MEGIFLINLFINLAQIWDIGVGFSLVIISWSAGDWFGGYAHFYPWTGTLGGLFNRALVLLTNFNFPNNIKYLLFQTWANQLL